MNNIEQRLNSLKARRSTEASTYKPLFYRLTNKEDEQAFSDLLSVPGLTVVDEIEGQLQEFVKFKYPSLKLKGDKLKEKVNAHVGDTSLFNYGVWVYYPWSARLVHVLDKEEFIILRCSRNHYKITPEEQTVLSQKKIGVIGLSVGQSVSVTLAMERICGELRIADFDVLELTNLNRIRTGIHNLGLYKVYSVAREIAEIDPFINVKCFEEGLHEKNMDTFFMDGGKLDLLIEESDGFDIKITSRLKARELKVPVLMEASDRCMVDVERFDLEPKRSILHGILDHLDVEFLKKLTDNEEKIPYMLDVLGIDSSSLRLRSSMLEIGESITTWPQLASAVTMGGGITADVARRILLNQFSSSGRYYVDVEEIIGDKKKASHHNLYQSAPKISANDLVKHLPAFPSAGDTLSKEIVEKLVAAGCQAPSASNLQPWRWIYRNNHLFLLNAAESDESFLGFRNLPAYIALGAAAANVEIEAGNLGLKSQLTFFPFKGNDGVVLVFNFTKTDTTVSASLNLAPAINERVTNRQRGPRKAIEGDFLQEFTKTVSGYDSDFNVKFFTDDRDLEVIGQHLGELEKVRLLDRKGHAEFIGEIRWTVEENENTKDGIDLRTIDLTNTEKVAMEVARDPNVIQMINEWNGGKAFRNFAIKAVNGAGAVGIINTTKKIGPETDLRGGMLMQRLWLNATLRGVALQPLAAPVFMFAPVLQGTGNGLMPKTRDSLLELRPEFEQVFDMKKGETEIFVFRLAIAGDPAVKSLRKPVDELFVYCQE
jgi:tRNA A37 threonylcarbamoyladenosine dehydratase